MCGVSSSGINTGDWPVSMPARRALLRAAARANRRFTAFVSQQDLLVAILQSNDEEATTLLVALPTLTSLRSSLLESDLTLASLEREGALATVEASVPLQESVELATGSGIITTESLLVGLLDNPRTHLLKMVARERGDLP